MPRITLPRVGATTPQELIDMPSMVYQNYALINELYRRDKGLPLVKVLIVHNHIPETAHFNTKDESAGSDILEFIRIHPGKAK